MTFNRRADGIIPERQDRPGTAKDWQYVVYHVLHEMRIRDGIFDRLDEAIVHAEQQCQDYDRVQIDQITVTRVWDNLMDYPFEGHGDKTT